MPRHLEDNLGRIDGGWGPVPGVTDVTVARFAEPGLLGVTAFATIGLSFTELHSPQGAHLRHELVMLIDRKQASGKVARTLQTVSAGLQRSGRALVRGDVIGPIEPLDQRSSLCFLYATVPQHLPEGFAVLESPEGTVVFVWLIPIGAHEADVVQRVGWRELEQKLEEVGPDLMDLLRPTVL